jgi:hypothetical protein
VLALIACKAGPAFGNGAISLFPLYGAAAFGLGPLGIGLMFSARGVGRCSARCCCAGRAPTRLGCSPCWPARCRCSGWPTCCSARRGSSGWCCCCLVLAHAGGGANWILSTYGMQRVVPDALRGRVFSADYTLATLVIACSQVAFGCSRTWCRPASCSRRPAPSCCSTPGVVAGLPRLPDPAATPRPAGD